MDRGWRYRVPAMTPDLISLLSCPVCVDTDLKLGEPVHVGGRVIAGNLLCPCCCTVYPIRDGIPRFVPEGNLPKGGQLQARTAHNFGDAWQVYAARKKNPYTEDQFLDWIKPLSRDDFANKIVLDLGSGLAGFTEYVTQYNPKQVVGLEISHAIDSSAYLLKDHPNLNLVQGNILSPPFKRAAFDLIYSIGVLHHLENPEEGFQMCAKLVKLGGRFFIWVYGQENNGFVIHVVEPMRKLAYKLPVRFVRYWIAGPLGLLLFLLLHTLYNPRLPHFFRSLPYWSYFQWLRTYGFGYVVGMVTDQLIPPRTNYHTGGELRRWYERAGFAMEDMTPRNNISWRVLGRRPNI